MQQLHITDPDGGSTGIPFWIGIPTEYQRNTNPEWNFLLEWMDKRGRTIFGDISIHI